MKIAGCTFFFILLLIVSEANAQIDRITDSIAKKMYWYALQNPSYKLFVHFDKNVYTNNENVWFTGYLLTSNVNDVHHTLSVAVIRNDDRSVLTEGRFVMDQQLAFGSFFLPDSLPAGNYSFVCYTNQMLNGYPSALFVQPVTVKSANAASLIANLSLVDSITPNMDSAKVLLKAYTSDVSLVKGADVTYYIGERSHPYKTGKTKTDNFGEAKMSIPLKQITGENNALQAEINNGKEIKTFTVKLPVYKKEAAVKFYPEGGNLVNDAKSLVGWEVKGNDGEPLLLSAGLYQNDQLLETIETNAYGIGKFYITPLKGSSYYVKLQTTDYPTDMTYKLPPALQNAPVINLSDALATDTLSLRLNAVPEGSQWIVMVHNFRTTFLTAPLIAVRSSTLLKISLEDVPKGLNTFTLLDTLGRPWAERLFFAHYDKKVLVNISTDSTSYLPRRKVELKFKITDAQQNSLKSLVSVACVQDNRLDIKKMTDIESYTYLKSELSSLPFKNKLLSDDVNNKEYLENLLLVKGWRKYTWQDLAMVKAKDTVQQKSSFVFKGITLMDNKPLKKPVQLNLRKFVDTKVSTLEYISTDSLGRFKLSPDNLLSEPERKLELTVNNRLKDFYILRITDPYKEMNKQLPATLIFDNYNLSSFSQTSQSVIIKKEEGGNRLLDVKVVAKNDTRIYALRGPNECGDYVCPYGILNCTNHPNEGYAPVVGNKYATRSGSSGPTFPITYDGCAGLQENIKKEFLLSMEGIYTKKDFYVTDFSKTDASDPQYASTLYWNHSLLTNDKGEAQATFYTSDIPGKFRIVIQGITNNNVLYGEYTFSVAKK